MKKPGIIIGLLREISNFSIIKSFINKGIEVTVFDSDPEAPGFFISGIYKKLISPDPESHPDDFMKFLFELGSNKPGTALLVNDDACSQLIADNKHELIKYFLFLCPDEQVNAIAFDKARTAQTSADYQVASPKTSFFNTLEDDHTNVNIDFPLVMKPRSSGGSRGQYFVKNSSELEQILKSLGKKKLEYIAQEWIPGNARNLCNLGVLFDEKSEPLAVFTCRKLSSVKSKHIYQGISTYYISEKIPEIIDIGLDFFRKIKWQGLAELEFKFDERDGTYKMFEINPRVWAWVRLPMECGIDFSKLYYDIVCGGKVKPQFDFRSGVTFLRTIIDSYSLYYKVKDRDISFSELCSDLYNKYSRVIFHPKDNLVEELPWNSPNLRWITYYTKRLNKYG